MTTTAAPAARRRTKTLVKPKVDSVLRIPEASWATRYVSRNFGAKSDFEVADYCLHTGRNLLVQGPTGPGKTTFFLAYAAFNQKFFYSVPSGGNAEPSQIFGKWVGTPTNGWEWIDGPAVQIVRNGGVLLINEINFMPATVMSTLFGLLDSRREMVLLDKKGEVIRAHRPCERDVRGKVVSTCWCDDPDGGECRSKWVLIAADMNPGYIGTRPLNEALQNRFTEKLLWDYDPTVEEALVVSKTLRKMAGDLRAAYSNRQYTITVSTNMLTAFEQAVLSMGRDYAADSFITAYPAPERSAARLVVNTNMDNIVKELRDGIEQAGPPDFSLMTEAEKTEWRLKLKPGEVDPEWGIYMKEWSWES